MAATPTGVERIRGQPEWQAGLLRTTAFCLAPPDLPNIKWWEELIGGPAEFRNLRVGVGELIEQGLVGDRTLQLQVHVARVDWIFSPKDQPDGDPFPSLGALAECLPAFQALISRWLDTAPSLNRLAFGVQLYIPSSSRAEAMGHIAEMLPYVRINAERMREFTFQVNRPRPCVTWPELGEVNRLATWQAVLRKRVVASFLPEVRGPVSVREEVAAFLELDINTPPDFGKEIPRHLSKEIFGELIGNGIEIVERGDRE